MEDIEKDLEKSCKCCPECDCGDDCHCTPDNKCCNDCNCDETCNCHDGEKCVCDDHCNYGDENSCNCDNNEHESCDCDEHCKCGDDCDCTKDDKCCGECTCDENRCDCADDCTCDDTCKSNEDNKCCNKCECEQDSEDVEDKCKCGCGESVEEETTADAYFKQMLSLRAEFDNYRKRTQNDISKAYSNGFNQAITEFLPALDSFKMATEYISDPNTLMGIQYIEKGILSTLEKMGISVIDTTGKFNPDFHQAIGSEVSSDHESGDIVKECFKGFMMGDKVIRYAQVIVAK